MNHEVFAMMGLRLLGGVFALISALCMLDPTLLLAPMEVGLQTPTALAEARAGYSGTFAGLAALFILGAERAEHRRLALGVAALVLGVFTLGRCVGLLVDGIPNSLAFANHAVEAVGAALALWLWRDAGRASETTAR